MNEIDKYLEPEYVEILREWWGVEIPEDHPTLWKDVSEISDRLWKDELFRTALLPLIRIEWEDIAWPVVWPDEIERWEAAERKRREGEERREPDAKSKSGKWSPTQEEESEEFAQLRRDIGA